MEISKNQAHACIFGYWELLLGRLAQLSIAYLFDKPSGRLVQQI